MRCHRLFLSLSTTLASVVFCLLDPVGADHCKNKNSSRTGFGFDEIRESPVKVNTIDYQATDLICCMHGYRAIEWYEFNGSSWVRFENRYWSDREFREDNQTAVLNHPYHRDSEEPFIFKCVGRGTSPPNVLNRTFHVFVREHVDPQSPSILIGKRNETFPVYHPPGDNSTLNITCQAYFGNVDVDRNCKVLWYVQESDGEEQVPVGYNKSHRVYSLPFREVEHGMALETTLVITQVNGSDYSIYYVCVASAVNSADDVRRIRISVPPDKHQPGRQLLLPLVLVVTLSTLSILVVGASWAQRTHFKLLYKEIRRSKPETEGLLNDIFLVSGDDANAAEDVIDFRKHVFDMLTNTHGPYRAFSVQRYVDMPAGRAEVTQFSEEIKNCRCVVVVLDKSFLGEKNCMYCLMNAPPEIDVIYVVYDLNLEEFQDAHKCEDLLGPAFMTQFGNQRDAGGVIELPRERARGETPVAIGPSRMTKAFWRRVRLAIPSSRRKVSIQVTV